MPLCVALSPSVVLTTSPPLASSPPCVAAERRTAGARLALSPPRYCPPFARSRLTYCHPLASRSAR
eukprot:2919434-Pyramimonas_sp.AAC.1